MADRRGLFKAMRRSFQSSSTRVVNGPVILDVRNEISRWRISSDDTSRTAVYRARGTGAGFRARRRCKRALRPRETLGKENHGLAVHHRLVPFAHNLKIRGALAERRGSAPAVGLQEI